VFKLKYEDRLNFSEWTRLLQRQVFLCIFLVSTAEALLYMSKLTAEHAFSFSELLREVIGPIAFLGVLYLATVGIVQYFIKKGNPFMQSIIMVCFVSMTCYVWVFRHYSVHSIYAIIAFPLLISLVYIDKKPLFFSLVTNMTMYLSFTAFVLRDPQRLGLDRAQSMTELVATVLFLMISYIACNVILLVLSRLVNSMIVKDEELKQDSFTGLFNHTAFYEQLDKMIEEHQKKGSRFSLVIWDIDNFKYINDNYGHEVGDKVILRFAEILKKVISPSDFAFRYGGDEFTLLIRRNAKETYSMALKIREIFYEAARRLNLDVQVTVSAGLCEYDHSLFFGSKEFFNATDAALYAAKGSENKDLIVSVHTSVWEEDVAEYQAKEATY